MIYTGESKIDREYISLSEEFFGGRKTALDVCVRVMTDGQDGDIINQYVVFTKVMDGQARIYGRTREAVKEAIRICKDRDVLKEYLENREKEVVDIMITLYDQQQVLEEYVASEKKKVADETAMNTAMKLYKMNLPVKDISEAVGYSMEIVRNWLDLLPQA